MNERNHEANRSKRIGILSILGVVVVLTVGTLAGFQLASLKHVSGRDAEPSSRSVITFDYLLTLKPDELQKLDIAVVNLLCAEGLLGGENINVGEATVTLDNWAKRVASETERYFYKFRQDPAGFNNSEAYFRMLTLVTVLQQDFRVRYNPERIQSPDFSDSRDLFLALVLRQPGGSPTTR